MVGEAKRKVLITGVSGMLGFALLRELASDYELIGLDLFDAQPSALSSFIKADITNHLLINKEFEELRPDIVIHTAAYTDVDGCEEDKKKAYAINAQGTKNIAEVCKRYNAVLFYISTDFIFDGKKKTPYTEEDRPNPINVYGKSKLAGERYVGDILKRYFIIRASWLFGPSLCSEAQLKVVPRAVPHKAKEGNFVDTVLGLAEKKTPIKIVNDQFGKPTYTIDLARAIHRCLSSDAYGVYHITNSGSCSWYEFAMLILELSSIKRPVLPIGSDELGCPAARPCMSVIDNAKYKRVFGEESHSWQEALRDYLNEATTYGAKRRKLYS